jgi:molybdate transport system substrate-binding protein
VIAIVVAGVLVAACGSDGSATDDAGEDASGSTSGGDVIVFAAASLTDAFTELGDAFTAANPDVEVTFNFAGSSELVAQISDGAPADVLASADLATMAVLADAELVDGDPQVFATNVAEIMVERGNPEGIDDVEDLAADDLIVVQCAPEVPCGSYAEQVLANAGVSVTPASYEDNVRGVVTKVTLGEADAGIVYRTDVLAAGDDADGVSIPDDVNVVAEYPIALVGSAADRSGAQSFVDFVLSADGRAVLAEFGFGPP